MSKVHVKEAPGDRFRGEFDRFYRDSPFEFDCTAEPVQKTRRSGHTVVSSKVIVVETRIRDVTSSLTATTNKS